jgi:hypothetical protein
MKAAARAGFNAGQAHRFETRAWPLKVILRIRNSLAIAPHNSMQNSNNLIATQPYS